MPKIALDRQTQDALSRVLARHLKEELDVDIEPFDAQHLLAFLADTLGPYYYNQGLQDAQAVMKDRVESAIDAVFEIELPLPTLR